MNETGSFFLLANRAARRPSEVKFERTRPPQPPVWASLSAPAIDRGQPGSVLVGLTAHEIEIPPLQPPRQLAHLPGADLVPVDAEDRLDLVARATQKRFLGVVDLGAVDVAFLGLLPGQLRQQV